MNLAHTFLPLEFLVKNEQHIVLAHVQCSTYFARCYN